jgi:hypothetical protein
MMTKKKIKTVDIEMFMEKKFETHSSQIFVTELRLSTGYSKTEQRADGFLMKLWPSDGFERTMFEYKISRSDFLKEINNPQKRQTAKSLADFFVLITANDIVHDKKEIPADCGWYVFNGNDLEIKIRPPRLIPVPAAPWWFTASLTRALYKKGIQFEQERSEALRS